MSVIQFPGKKEIEAQRLTADQEWEELERLNEEVQSLLHQIGRYGRKEERAQNFLRYRFNVRHHSELTIAQMRQALPHLRQIASQSHEFSKRMHAISDAFDVEIVGKGTPWTPAIARKVGRKRMHLAGDKPNWEELLREMEAEMGIR